MVLTKPVAAASTLAALLAKACSVSALLAAPHAPQREGWWAPLPPSSSPMGCFHCRRQCPGPWRTLVTEVGTAALFSSAGGGASVSVCRRGRSVVFSTASPIDSRSSSASSSSGASPKDQQDQQGQKRQQDEEQQEQKMDQFDWHKSWYPLVPVEYLDVERPHAFRLLGMDLVVWYDGKAGSGQFQSKKERRRRSRRLLHRLGLDREQHERTGGTWRVFEDECPHRKVPLSEGRVEDDGTLLCSYHAWRFDGHGEVASVPQAAKTELDRVKSNPKSSCNAFPSKVVNGLLWVWPVSTGGAGGGSSGDAFLESELTKLPVMALPHEVHDDIDQSRLFLSPWNFRHLPYGHDFFIENVVDVAHVPASHHNIVGDRYTEPKPIEIKNIDPVSKSGFSISVHPSEQEKEEGGGLGEEGEGMTDATSDRNGDGDGDGGSGPTTVRYTAPCLVEINQPVGTDGARTILELYSSPSVPGFCNHIGRQVIVKTKKGEVPSFLKLFLMPMPLWLLHVLSNTFLNQDALFLHAQERRMHQGGLYSTLPVPSGGEGGGGEVASYHYTKAILPITSDRGVINFRNWMRTKAGGSIPYRRGRNDGGGIDMPPVSNEVVFDTYNGHTKNCRYCTDALRRLRMVRYGAFGAAALVVATVKPRSLAGTVGSVALAAALGVVGVGANKLMKLMNRMEFSHSDND